MTEFTKLGLSAHALQAIAETGYTEATPIQSQAIPVALAGRDVLGIAQTGTGKTAAFTLPMIDRLSAGRARARMPRALVLAPTRELADQVGESFRKYAKGTRLSWALLIGGVSMGDQVAALDKGVDVLIATPGRLLDLFERGKILLTGVQIMVVDEADRMLDMGFIPDIERIFKLTPPRRQTLFFSATMPPEITRLTEAFLKDPTRIEVSRPATTADTISQFMTRLPTSDPKAKRTALRALIERADVRNGIVFCNRKSDVDIVAKSLSKHGLDAAPIHGDLDQSLRMKTLASFRAGDLKLLVASDVAARGLDIPEVSHVFNYDVPYHPDDYVHRIGRTGRAGRTGEAYMIVTPQDDKALDKLLKLIKKTPQELDLDIDLPTESRGKPAGRKASSPEPSGAGRTRRGAAKSSDAPAPAMSEAQGTEPQERAAEETRTRADKPEKKASKPRSEKADKLRVNKDSGDKDGGRASASKASRSGDSTRAGSRADTAARGRSRAQPEPVGASAFGSASDVPAFLRRGY